VIVKRTCFQTAAFGGEKKTPAELWKRAAHTRKNTAEKIKQTWKTIRRRNRNRCLKSFQNRRRELEENIAKQYSPPSIVRNIDRSRFGWRVKPDLQEIRFSWQNLQEDAVLCWYVGIPRSKSPSNKSQRLIKINLWSDSSLSQFVFFKQQQMWVGKFVPQFMRI